MKKTIVLMIATAIMAFVALAGCVPQQRREYEEIYVIYEDDSKTPSIFADGKSVMVCSQPKSDSWECVEKEEDALDYFVQAKEIGATDVIYLIDGEPGVLQGPTFEIDDVIKGYEEGTWSFEEESEEYKKGIENEE